jgi:hypothetical protein
MEDDDMARVSGIPERNAYKFHRKPEGKEPFGKSRHAWDYSIKVDLTDVECDDVDWIHLA